MSKEPGDSCLRHSSSVLTTRGTRTFFSRLPESENCTIVTSWGSFDVLAFTSRGFLSVHKTMPATAEAEARRNSRRLNLTDDASRSRSDSNIDDCSSNTTCPYRGPETAGGDERLSARRCTRYTDCLDDAQHNPGGKPRPDKRPSIGPLGSRSGARRLWLSRAARCRPAHSVLGRRYYRKWPNGTDCLDRVLAGSTVWDRGPRRRRLEEA